MCVPFLLGAPCPAGDPLLSNPWVGAQYFFEFQGVRELVVGVFLFSNPATPFSSGFRQPARGFWAAALASGWERPLPRRLLSPAVRSFSVPPETRLGAPSLSSPRANLPPACALLIMVSPITYRVSRHWDLRWHPVTFLFPDALIAPADQVRPLGISCNRAQSSLWGLLLTRRDGRFFFLEGPHG